MTSSQPVITPDTINFTPDNKRFYIYSAPHDADTTIVTLLEFQTNSEYLQASVHYTGYMGPDWDSASAGLRGICSIYFNDVRVYQIMSDNDNGNMAQTYGPVLIIPPFTKVTVKSNSTSDTADYVVQCALTGEAYGMTKTEYQ